MSTTPPDLAPSNYPREGVGDNLQTLRDVAKYQKQVLMCVLGYIIAAVGNGYVRATGQIELGIGVFLFSLVVFVCMIGAVVRLSKAMFLPKGLYALLMFIPCVSLLALLHISSKATSMLKASGVKVGILGADPMSIK